MERTNHQILEGSGTQFDPTLAQVAVRLIQEGVLGRIWKTTGANEELYPAALSGL